MKRNRKNSLAALALVASAQCSPAKEGDSNGFVPSFQVATNKEG